MHHLACPSSFKTQCGLSGKIIVNLKLFWAKQSHSPSRVIEVEWFQGLIGQSYKWVGPLLRAEILLDWQVNLVEPDASIGWLGSSILVKDAVWGVRRVKYVQVMIFTKRWDIQCRWYHRTDCSICYVPVGVAVETGMAVAALVEEDTCTLLGSCWR